MKKLAVLALGVFLAACSETPTETPTMDVPEAAYSVVLPGGQGVQKFSEDRDGVCGLLCTGIYVPAPFFLGQGTEFTLETGNWVTLGFGIVTCCTLEEPTPEEVLANALAFVVDALGGQASLDGHEIPVAENFRSDGIQIYEVAAGVWESTIPWRYYVKPQRKGSYVYQWILGGGTSERLITYEPDEA